MGSPEYIRNSLREYEDAHIDMVVFIAQSGDRPHEDIMDLMELFAKEVMPQVRGAPPSPPEMAGTAIARCDPHGQFQYIVEGGPLGRPDSYIERRDSWQR